jgi:hypothetical protein
MATTLRTLAIYFVRAHPNASIKEAIDYANDHFAESPSAVSAFVRDWLNLRDRLADATRETFTGT